MKTTLLLICSSLLLIGCNEKKDSDSNNNLVLLALVSQANAAPALSTLSDSQRLELLNNINSPVGRANVAVQSASSAVGSATSTSNLATGSTAPSPRQDDRAVALNLDNLLSGKFFSFEPKVTANRNTTGITVTEIARDSNGNRQFTYAGSIQGFDYFKSLQERTLKYDFSVNGTACNFTNVIELPVFTSATSRIGSLAITNGRVSYSDYASATSFVSNNSANLSFTDYQVPSGVADPIQLFTAIKAQINMLNSCSLPATSLTAGQTQFTFALTGSNCTCTIAEPYNNALAELYKFVGISGALTVSSQSKSFPFESTFATVSGVSTTKSVTNLDSNSTLNSESLKITTRAGQSSTASFRDLNIAYKGRYEYTFTSQTGQPTRISNTSGSLTFTLKGTSSGTTLNDTVTYTF